MSKSWPVYRRLQSSLCCQRVAVAEERSSGKRFRDFEKVVLVAVEVTSGQGSGSNGSGLKIWWRCTPLTKDNRIKDRQGRSQDFPKEGDKLSWGPGSTPTKTEKSPDLTDYFFKEALFYQK